MAGISRELQNIVGKATKSEAITPDDNNDQYFDAIDVGTGGDLNVMLRDDTAATVFPNRQSGSVFPYAVKRIMSTSTDAADLVGLTVPKPTN